MLQEKRLKQIEYVVNNAEHVKLNEEKLEQWSDCIKDSVVSEHPWSQYKKDFTEKEMILLAFFIESMNFCFWKEPIFRYKDKKKSTAMMDMFIDAAIENKELLNPEYVSKHSYEDLINVFGMEEGNLKNRYNSLVYTAKRINDNKEFFNELFNVKSTEELYELIIAFENFNDISTYKGE